MKKTLAGFIKALKENRIFTFKVNRFDARLKLQKYVYLARKFGLNLDYNYNLYIHGPYSPELAKEYYALGNIKGIKVDLDERFVDLIKGKSEQWLELAATIVMVFERYSNISDEMVIELVKSSKPFATEKELREIIKKLKNAGARSICSVYAC